MRHSSADVCFLNKASFKKRECVWVCGFAYVTVCVSVLLLGTEGRITYAHDVAPKERWKAPLHQAAPALMLKQCELQKTHKKVRNSHHPFICSGSAPPVWFGLGCQYLSAVVLKQVNWTHAFTLHCTFFLGFFCTHTRTHARTPRLPLHWMLVLFYSKLTHCWCTSLVHFCILISLFQSPG